MKISCIVVIFLFATVFASPKPKASHGEGGQYRSVHRLKRDADHSVSYGGSVHGTYGSHGNSGVGRSNRHEISKVYRGPTGFHNGFSGQQGFHSGFSGQQGFHSGFSGQQGFHSGYINGGRTVHDSGSGQGGRNIHNNGVINSGRYGSGYRYKK